MPLLVFHCVRHFAQQVGRSLRVARIAQRAVGKVHGHLLHGGWIFEVGRRFQPFARARLIAWAAVAGGQHVRQGEHGGGMAPHSCSFDQRKGAPVILHDAGAAAVAQAKFKVRLRAGAIGTGRRRRQRKACQHGRRT